jgi:hypothetical protein
MAICLAVARAVAMTYYRLDANEIVSSERASSVMELVTPPPSMGSEGTSEGVALVIRTKENVPESVARSLATTPEITEEEHDIVSVLLRCCVGIIPL